MAQSKIVNAFFCPEFYDHPVDYIKLVETHISWVFLTGSFAYKIKKPVDFGFLNFTTLKQRNYFCHQELLLNSRFAPSIYIEVLPVTESESGLSLAGQGKVIDYAIKMNQFDQQCLFNSLLRNHQVELYHIDNLIDAVADFHHKINIAGSDVNFGSAQEVLKPVAENFSILINSQLCKQDKQNLTSLFEQVLAMYELIQPYLLKRKKQGFIRECHGDLHLGNITIIENKVLLFDGIEFNDSFRWIDTMSDCAFLIMDLQDHEQTVFANHFLNGYLLKTGDYSGLFVLKFYKLYRAMVRAKVAGLRLQQQKKKSIAYKNTLNELRNYLQLAQDYLHITHLQ
ncbi:MAG: aminoglycoside phosphotransferase, partial [Gammaproteobacteria bacterium]|nr:aminoglycoside phosphotransferase [Gammaproteobacteria bacterium]